MEPNCKTTAFGHRLLKGLYLVSGMSQLFVAPVGCLTVKMPEMATLVITWNKCLLDTDLWIPST